MLLLIFFVVIFPPEASFGYQFNNLHQDALEIRNSQWPNWNLPGPFKISGLKKDIYYPSAFQGEWQVVNVDLINSKNKVFKYKARFKDNSENKLIADREFNSRSIGKSLLGNQFINIQNDPKNINRQLAIFKNREYLESKVIGRNQSNLSEDTFIADELVLQIYHSQTKSRINQVETLSKYFKCKNIGIEFSNLKNEPICGQQLQAKYAAPGESFSSKPLNLNKYQIFLFSNEDSPPSDDFLVDLATQKEQIIQDHQ